MGMFKFEVYLRKSWRDVSGEYIIINLVDLLKERTCNSEKYVEELLACKYSYIKSTGWMFKMGTGLKFLKNSYKCNKKDWESILNGDISKLIKEMK